MIVYGIQFKSEAARKKWQKELNLETVAFGNGDPPLGTSLFKVGTTETEMSRETAEARKSVLALLGRRMKKAAELRR